METKRFLPCSLIRHREKGTLHIVQHDYTYMYGPRFGGYDYDRLSLYNLDENGDIVQNWSWADAKDYELVDETNNRARLQKITEYEQRLIKKLLC